MVFKTQILLFATLAILGLLAVRLQNNILSVFLMSRNIFLIYMKYTLALFILGAIEKCFIFVIAIPRAIPFDTSTFCDLYFIS